MRRGARTCARTSARRDALQNGCCGAGRAGATMGTHGRWFCAARCTGVLPAASGASGHAPVATAARNAAASPTAAAQCAAARPPCARPRPVRNRACGSARSLGAPCMCEMRGAGGRACTRRRRPSRPAAKRCGERANICGNACIVHLQSGWRYARQADKRQGGVRRAFAQPRGG